MFNFLNPQFTVTYLPGSTQSAKVVAMILMRICRFTVLAFTISVSLILFLYFNLRSVRAHTYATSGGEEKVVVEDCYLGEKTVFF